MRRMIPAIRRGLVLSLMGAAAAAVWTRLNNERTSPTLPDSPGLTAVDREPGTVKADPTVAPTDATLAEEPSNGESVVTAATDADERQSGELLQLWVPPNDDGSTPDTHPIKAKNRSGIYHVPGGSSYNRTKAERCYASPEAAETDGYRQAKS